MKQPLRKTIVIVGPTASGKSDLAIALAQKYDGEIISADSRQVYRGMDIGTGKVTKNEQELVRHWLLDVASPKRSYNVTHFIRDAKKIIAHIQKRRKLAIICGGTGFWVEALLFEKNFPKVKPIPALRKKLEKLSTEKLFLMLKQEDPARAATIDQYNKVRLIRALEIIEFLGKVPPLTSNQRSTINKECLVIALVPPQETLHKNINLRLDKRFAQGMIEEVETLRKNGVSFKRLESFGLEYRFVSLFLQKRLALEEMKKQLEMEIRRYAKRQLTFLRRLERSGLAIHWISDPKKAESLISKM
ncbi:MAG: tRNA (adenosine(37)-N6)-dimethylallyltransferase MiaA [Candidatus Moranbacteria bacterium]|nr:tRNA (adenosine(37)-N6)-dimethylallyltransferase MiaA [Candidatus Moranbacteria bacterium]